MGDSPTLWNEASLENAAETHALVSAWQSGATSRDTLLHNLRTREVLPPARKNEQAMDLNRKETAALPIKSAVLQTG